MMIILLSESEGHKLDAILQDAKWGDAVEDQNVTVELVQGEIRRNLEESSQEKLKRLIPSVEQEELVGELIAQTVALDKASGLKLFRLASRCLPELFFPRLQYGLQELISEKGWDYMIKKDREDGLFYALVGDSPSDRQAISTATETAIALLKTFVKALEEWADATEPVL